MIWRTEMGWDDGGKQNRQTVAADSKAILSAAAWMMSFKIKLQ